MWANESVFYQIYPFGACGAPFENDHVLEHRIHKLEDFIPHLKKLKIDIFVCCALCPDMCSSESKIKLDLRVLNNVANRSSINSCRPETIPFVFFDNTILVVFWTIVLVFILFSL